MNKLIPFTFTNPFNLLKKPGDKMSAEITPTGRKVAKIKLGDVKRSKTVYPGGRTVETLSYQGE